MRQSALLHMETKAHRTLPGSELKAVGKRQQSSHLILRQRVSRYLAGSEQQNFPFVPKKPRSPFLFSAEALLLRCTVFRNDEDNAEIHP